MKKIYLFKTGDLVRLCGQDSTYPIELGICVKSNAKEFSVLWFKGPNTEPAPEQFAWGEANACGVCSPANYKTWEVMTHPEVDI